MRRRTPGRTTATEREERKRVAAAQRDEKAAAAAAELHERWLRWGRRIGPQRAHGWVRATSSERWEE